MSAAEREPGNSGPPPDGADAASAPARGAMALRFELTSGACAMPLHRLHHLAGYATLAGEPEDYFLGWLRMRGELVPVFDLNRVVCDEPTPVHFGSRIMVVKTPESAPTPYLGLLAARITDTTEMGSASVEPFDPDSYLPMLYPMIPQTPEDSWRRT